MQEEPFHRLLAVGTGAVEMVEDDHRGAFRLSVPLEQVGHLLPQDAQSAAGMRCQSQPFAQSQEGLGGIEAANVDNRLHERGR